MKYLIKLISVIIVALTFYTSCEYEETPCYEIECEDNQVCLDGSCVDFSEISNRSSSVLPPIPKNVILYDFYITRFPSKKVDGSNWDNNSNPDIFIQIIQNAEILYETPSSITNLASTSLPYKLSLDTPLKLNEVENVFTVHFYDDDGNGFDEFMGGVTFTPFQKDYNPTIVADKGGPIALELSAIYEF